MLKYFIAVLLVIPLLIMMAPLGIIMYLKPNWFNFKFRYHYLRILMKWLCIVLRVKNHVKGLENIPKKGSFLITPNHQSFFDAICLIAVSKRPFTYVAKKETKKMPIVGIIVKILGGFYLDRENVRQSLQLMKRVEEFLKNNDAGVVIFPEGTRTKSKDLMPVEFKGGSYKVAYKAEVPSVIDSYRVVSIGKNAFREYPDTEYHLGSVTLPTSVKSIGYGSFRDCDMLTSIDFGGTESIGDYAFYMCDGLEGISIPESINSVGYGAFSYCSKLIKAELLGTQTAIGGYCFYMTPESFTIRGYYPSTAYSYALENSHAFEDIIPYEAPVINGVTEGEKLNVAEFAEGIVISWTSPYECSALLNGEKYPAGTAITSPGEYTFTVSDGRTEASVSFTVFYLKKIIPGDYDGDEEITVSDALLTLRVAVGITEVTEDILLKADMDADGIISVTDALTVLRIAIKLDEPREPFYPEQGE